MNPNDKSLRKEIEEQTREGAFWTSMRTFIQEALQFALGIVMARLLLPEVFGIYGTATIFTNIGSVIFELGLFTSIIQRKSLG
jgi:O-antigen/teichoic acid export membrane protein